MLRFQTEDDTQTGEKVLTCYLLPQQPPPSLGRSLAVGSIDPGVCAASGKAWVSLGSCLLQRTQDSGAALQKAGVMPLSAVSAPSSSWRPLWSERMPRKQLLRSGYGGPWAGRPLPADPLLCPSLIPLLLQGLQRRATPHPSELRVMRKGMEERRNEAFCRPGPGTPSPLEEVPVGPLGCRREPCPQRSLPGAFGVSFILGVGL